MEHILTDTQVSQPAPADLAIASFNFKSSLSSLLASDEIRERIKGIRERGQGLILGQTILSSLAAGGGASDALAAVLSLALDRPIKVDLHSTFDPIQLVTGRLNPTEKDLIAAVSAIMLPLFTKEQK